MISDSHAGVLRSALIARSMAAEPQTVNEISKAAAAAEAANFSNFSSCNGKSFAINYDGTFKPIYINELRGADGWNTSAGIASVDSIKHPHRIDKISWYRAAAIRCAA